MYQQGTNHNRVNRDRNWGGTGEGSCNGVSEFFKGLKNLLGKNK